MTIKINNFQSRKSQVLRIQFKLCKHQKMVNSVAAACGTGVDRHQ